MCYECSQRGSGGGLLKGKSGFLKIYDLIENAMNKAEVVYNPTLEQLLEADKWAREITRQELSKL